MKKRTLVSLLTVAVGVALGLGAYFALHAGLFLSLLVVLGIFIIVGVVAQIVGILSRSEGLK